MQCEARDEIERVARSRYDGAAHGQHNLPRPTVTGSSFWVTLVVAVPIKDVERVEMSNDGMWRMKEGAKHDVH